MTIVSFQPVDATESGRFDLPALHHANREAVNLCIAMAQGEDFKAQLEKKGLAVTTISDGDRATIELGVAVQAGNCYYILTGDLKRLGATEIEKGMYQGRGGASLPRFYQLEF